MKYAVLLALMMTGCAHKRVSTHPGKMHYIDCKEVSVNAKTGETTVICPPQKKEK